MLLAAVTLGEAGDYGVPAPIAAAGGDRSTIRSAGLTAHVAISTTTVTATTMDERLLLLDGEIYGESARDFSRRLLSCYTRNGKIADILRTAHGSFTCLLIDARSRCVVLMSDHVNNRRLFWSRDGNRYWISNFHTFNLHPSGSLSLDPAGLASSLVNGVPINGRTLYTTVATTHRATIHTITRTAERSECYWSYGFSPGNGSLRSLKDDLADLIVSAVRRRVLPNESLFVSLSGGYDSTTLVGALRANAVEGVKCLSYTKLQGAKQPDVLVARDTARMASYEHRTIAGFSAPVQDVLLDNLTLGHGQTRLVAATDAWREVRTSLEAERPSCLFVGDESCGWDEGVFRSGEDVVHAVGFADWSGAGWLRSQLPRRTDRLFDEAVRAEYADILASYPSYDDFQDFADWLYIEHRLPRILAWREAFAARGAPVRQPLLDNEILKFMQSVPPHLRRNRLLFRESVTDRFPGLFAAARPQGRWEVRLWARQVIAQSSVRIESMITSGESPLDEWIPPAALLALLRRQRRRAVMKAGKQVLAGVRRRFGPVVGRRLNQSGPAARKQVDENVLLLRTVFLRLLLQNHFH